VLKSLFKLTIFVKANQEAWFCVLHYKSLAGCIERALDGTQQNDYVFFLNDLLPLHVPPQVPLLDMYRYHKLLAGASWVGEYGDPDVADEWAYLQHYSPYHNLQGEAPSSSGTDMDAEHAAENDAGGKAVVVLPPVLFTTSTRDDRVHPGHARKMVKKLLDLGHEGTTAYYENLEGGHGGAADNKQRAFMSTLAYGFLEKSLTGGGATK
jgi:prolyl oligopeptidase